MLDAPTLRIKELLKSIPEATPLLNAQAKESVSLAASLQLPFPYLCMLAEVHCISLTRRCLLQSIAGTSTSGHTAAHIEKVGVGIPSTSTIFVPRCRSYYHVRSQLAAPRSGLMSFSAFMKASSDFPASPSLRARAALDAACASLNAAKLPTCRSLPKAQIFT